MVSDILVNLLKQFCSEGLLYWVEVSSLLGDLQSLILSLDNVRQALASGKPKIYLLYFSRDFAKSVLCIHFAPQF
jgi:hypothetical protein